nr:unnamed protein product [Digitaria exilis]
MMPRFLALVAITISVLSSIHASAIDMRATDRAALLSFKSGVWGNLSDWGSPQMCNWTGVTCDPRGLVIRLLLSNSNLTGVVSPAIGNLSALETLELHSNQLSGNIPPQLGMLSQLVNLSLDNNTLNGPIPETLGLLKNITYLSLSDNNLNGSIPEAIVCNCSSLSSIDLSNNSLTGEIILSTQCQPLSLNKLILYNNGLTGIIPSSMSNFTSLEWLLLQSNFLGSVLPSKMFNGMSSLKFLYLSNNNFSGDGGGANLEPFLASLVNCTCLEELGLDSNGMRDKIPPTIGNLSSTNLSKLYLYDNKITELWFANFSYNNFIGEVSSEGSFANLTADSFLDNPGLCGSILGMAPCRGKHGHFLYIAITVIIAIAAILLAMVCIFYHDLMKICLRLTPPSFQLSSIPTGLVNTIGEKEGDHPRISYRELVDATDGFSEANLIGKGGYGHVYRGVLHGGTVIAVKALHNDYVGEVIAGSFERECRVIRSIRHRNLIRVITACSTPEFKAIVLPFMPNGNLDSLIHGPPGGGKPEGPQHKLDLDMVLSIASNIAEGMAYLHHHAPVKVVHCDLKPSNVLLDGDMTAIVSDFGISKLVINGARDPEMGEASTSVSSSITRLLQGSVGYIAPEYGLCGRPSTQGDVYSFGVMLLEMISGKRPTDVISEEGHGLHDWAKKRCLEHDLDAIVKCLLLHDSPSVQPFGLPGCEMEAVAVVMELLELGVACSQLAPSMRPDMDDVAHEIACVRDGTWRKYRATDLNAIGQKKFRE